MKEITVHDLDDLATGATLLGTGGGGDPFVGKLMAKQAILNYGPVKVIKASELHDEKLVIPVGAIGAPSVSNERIASEEELYAPVSMIEEVLGQKAQAIMPIEIGGGNSMIPIACAAKLGLPLVDADAMGRAFPESQMVTFYLAGHQPDIVALADCQGNRLIYYPKDGAWSEKIARAVTDVMGGSANMADNIFPGRIVKECAIEHTLSLAKKIGHLINNQMNEGATTEVIKALNGYHLFEGKIHHIQRNVVGGFTRGETYLSGIETCKGEEMQISFQNELLLAKRNGQLAAVTPDLIAVLDHETGQPITTETLRYGARVHVIALPCDKKWRTEKGIEVAGPEYFGYDVAYTPVETLYAKEESDV